MYQTVTYLKYFNLLSCQYTPKDSSMPLLLSKFHIVCSPKTYFLHKTHISELSNYTVLLLVKLEKYKHEPDEIRSTAMSVRLHTTIKYYNILCPKLRNFRHG